MGKPKRKAKRKAVPTMQQQLSEAADYIGRHAPIVRQITRELDARKALLKANCSPGTVIVGAQHSVKVVQKSRSTCDWAMFCASLEAAGVDPAVIEACRRKATSAKHYLAVV